MASRLCLTGVLLTACCSVLANAAPSTSGQAEQQQPPTSRSAEQVVFQQPFAHPASAFAAAEEAIPPAYFTHSDAINLHRFCLPSAYALHWPRVLASLEELQGEVRIFALDVWSEPRDVAIGEDHSQYQSCMDFTWPEGAVADGFLERLVHEYENVELDWEIQMDNEGIYDLLARERRQGTSLDVQSWVNAVEDPFHNGYHSLPNITAFLSYQVALHPSLAELVDMGVSYEGQIIQGIRLGQRSDGQDGEQSGRKEFVVVAGSHGREWITTATSLYLVSALLDNPSMLQSFSVLIIPSLNPDGYRYTWTTDRFFRKNRQVISDRRDWLGRRCYGVDVSRNFPTHFKRGFWQNPCSPTFAGEEPLQAQESKVLASYLSREDSNVIGFIDLHSYGQLLLYPWLSCSPSNDGHEADMPDEEDLSEVALGASRAARKTHNRVYRTGRGCQTMYGQDGSAVDFAYADAKIKWSFELELRDEGAYGFMLPPDQIRPTGEETWAMLKYIFKFVKARERL